jgi:hypothetical protein
VLNGALPVYGFFHYTPRVRRRYVLALVLATALIFSLAGYYGRTLRDDQGESGYCILQRAQFEYWGTGHLPNDADTVNHFFEKYDDYCR